MKRGGTVEMDVSYEVDAGYVTEPAFYFIGSKKEMNHIVNVDKAVEIIQERFEDGVFESMSSGQRRGWMNNRAWMNGPGNGSSERIY
jgi:ABC-type molybdenum transport system ATPase subunit/photorepair protein PhrA